MNQREAFVAAIIDKPQDDSLRLQFADWLEENGEAERAEFIRVQIELEQDLFKWQWNEELGGFAATDNPAPLYRRGFVAAISCTAADWLAHGDELTQVAPIEKVTLTTLPNDVVAVMGPYGKFEGRLASRLKTGELVFRLTMLMDHYELTMSALEHEWPKIKFEISAQEYAMSND